MKNHKQTLQFPLFLSLLFALFLFGFPLGCSSSKTGDTSKAESKTSSNSENTVQPLDEEVELKKFRAESKKSITKDNADQIAKQLEKEIEADLAKE